MTALRITVIYVVVGALWILVSDSSLAALVRDSTTLSRLQTIKGWFFILVTALPLYLLIHRSVAALQRSEGTLRAVIESIPDAVLLVDPLGNLVDINRATRELVGVDQGMALPTPLPEFFERFNLRRHDGTRVAYEESGTALALRGETVCALA